MAGESSRAAIEQISQWISKYGIDCDFSRVDGYLFLGAGDSGETLQHELHACHRAGLSRVKKLARAPFDSFNTGPCLHFPSVAQFHALKFLRGLADAIEDSGGRIFSATHVDDVQDGKTPRVRAGAHVVTARAVVVATELDQRRGRERVVVGRGDRIERPAIEGHTNDA